MKVSWFERLAVQALAAPRWPSPRFPPSRYYRFLRVLAANVHPALSVELGVCGGGASLHLAVGWPEGTVVGVEHANGSPWERENWRIIRRRCPNWRMWHGDSVESAPEIAKIYGAVDILFQDSVHETWWTIKEFEAWHPFLSDRAVVCFDDLHRTEMEGFWEWLPGENKVRLDDLHQGSTEGGFGVWWR